MSSQQFGKLVKKARKEVGLTQEEPAKKNGRSSQLYLSH